MLHILELVIILFFLRTQLVYSWWFDANWRVKFYHVHLQLLDCFYLLFLIYRNMHLWSSRPGLALFVSTFVELSSVRSKSTKLKLSFSGGRSGAQCLHQSYEIIFFFFWNLWADTWHFSVMPVFRTKPVNFMLQTTEGARQRPRHVRFKEDGLQFA